MNMSQLQAVSLENKQEKSGLIYAKMSEVMANISHVSKDKTNTQQNFKFRGIDQFINALYPAMVKAGIFVSPKVESVSTEMREVPTKTGVSVEKHVSLLVSYRFVASDGSSVTVGPIAAEGIDRGDKATNKALSAALKYALIQTFFVPTEDMAEADFDTSTTISKIEADLTPTPLSASGDAKSNPSSLTSSSRPRTFKKQATKPAEESDDF